MTEDTRVALDCGRTVEELSAYLADGGTPFDPTIETCPECLNALEGLAGVSALSQELLAAEAATIEPPPESWLHDLMANISAEARAGRSLPLRHPDPRVAATVTEGAVRALIRSVGDGVDGLLVGACTLVGDVEALGAPIRITVRVSVPWGHAAMPLGAELRGRLGAALAEHTDLLVETIDVVVTDVHEPAFISDGAAR